ncbi:hypothetical protein BV20DRAFT_998165 [Pilatotrama ljubarskyi]|nr:hypothetical protein BV20DRAFT_998165 [Pilatotrama ljubarskyi]
MQRDWNDQEREAWIARRTERRKRLAPPPAAKGPRDPQHPRKDSLDEERGELLKNLFQVTTRTLAWELQKHPSEPYPAPLSGKLMLPLTYQGDDHARTIKFKEGDDLNLLVYNFYSEPPDAGFEGLNYVTPNSFIPKRHEYLGPAPHVTGYRFSAAERTARIEWWDPYVQTLWIGRGTWRIDVYFDETVHGWVSRPRGDFDRAADLETYMGA